MSLRLPESWRFWPVSVSGKVTISLRFSCVVLRKRRSCSTSVLGAECRDMCRVPGERRLG